MIGGFGLQRYPAGSWPHPVLPPAKAGIQRQLAQHVRDGRRNPQEGCSGSGRTGWVGIGLGVNAPGSVSPSGWKGVDVGVSNKAVAVANRSGPGVPHRPPQATRIRQPARAKPHRARSLLLACMLMAHFSANLSSARLNFLRAAWSTVTPRPGLVGTSIVLPGSSVKRSCVISST